MPITIITSQFENPFGYFQPYYKSNAGDVNTMRLFLKESIEVVSGSSAYLSRNPIDNIITWTGGNWELEGFRFGDHVACIKYDSSGNVLFGWNANVVSVNGNLLDLDVIPTWINATNGEIIRIVALRKREGLIVDVNHVSNGETGSEYSFIDNEVTRFSFDILNNNPTGLPIGNQSGQYVISTNLKTLEDNLEYREYALEIEFLQSGIDSPSLFLTSNCLKVYAKMRWQTILGEPSNNTIQVYNPDADTGWFNEPYNLETARSVLVQGISSELDYTGTNNVSVIVELINSGNPIFAFGGSYLPTNDQYYKNQPQSQNELSIVLPTTELSVAGTTYSYVNPNGASWNVTTSSIVNITGDQYEINLTIDFSGLSSFIDNVEDGDRKFIIWIKADNINHIIFEDQLTKVLPVGGPLDMQQNRFLYHNENVAESPNSANECEANIEDDIAFSGAWKVQKNAVVSNVVASIVSVNSDTDESFTLGSVVFDFSLIPMQFGMYPINAVVPVITTLPNTSMKLNALLFRDVSYDDENSYGLRILFPFLLRWEYWLSQLNADNDFYPNQNKNWFPYDSTGNWGLRLNLSSAINNLEYTFHDDIIMKNYDSDDNIDSDLQLYFEGQQVQVVTEGQQMEVIARHVVNTGEVWEQESVWGMITVEPKESSPRSICSTIVPFDNNLSNPLQPYSGSQFCELTFPDPITAQLRCIFIPNNVDLSNGVKFTSKIKGCFQEGPL